MQFREQRKMVWRTVSYSSYTSTPYASPSTNSSDSHPSCSLWVPGWQLGCLLRTLPIRSSCGLQGLLAVMH